MSEKKINIRIMTSIFRSYAELFITKKKKSPADLKPKDRLTYRRNAQLNLRKYKQSANRKLLL